jgi:acetylglutamate kinase
VTAGRDAGGGRAEATSEAPLVVKLGGTTIAEEQGILGEIAALSRTHRIVVVHGGGKRLTEWLDRLGVEHRFHEGRRVTDDAALEVAVAVLRGVISTELVAELRRHGARAAGVSGVDGGLLVGRRAPELGRVVVEARADRRVLDSLLAGGFVPVVAPVALDEVGTICNVNADDAAAALAAGLGGRLVLLTDTDGVRGADGQRLPTLRLDAAERLIADGTIAGGMVPKVRSASLAVRGGSEAVIADGRTERVLASVVAGDPIGTRIDAPADRG